MNKKDKQRIVIIGTSCSGKTTLAKQLSTLLDCIHIELDELHWKPDWVERENDKFRALAAKEVEKDRWVVDGNYSVVRDIVWERATTIIWLNYAFPVVLYRAISRSCKRSATQQVLFSDNRETFRQSFFSKDSIILWVIKTHHQKKKRYTDILYNGSFSEKCIIELNNQSQADAFLKKLK